MKINNKNNYKKTLIAIKIDDQLNVDKKKKFDFFTKNNSIYFLFENTLTINDLSYYSSSLRKFFSTLKESINIDITSFIKFENEKITKCNIILPLLSAISFNLVKPFTMKTSKEEKINVNLLVDKKDNDCINKNINIVSSHEFCRKMQDMPRNFLSSIDFVEHVKKLFSPFKNKIKIKILTKKDMVSKKMGLILGVNAGSVVEPRLISIEFKNNKNSKELLGIIGKGITFDSGGMNIKTGNNMKWMKYDMSGAAIVISTLYALVKNNEKTNVVAIAALTDNLVSPNAIRPDDILTSYNGKTVEIDNTDAEGRLVLADAITYAIKDEKVTKIIDIATLTGAMVFSLGETYTGAWATNEEDWAKFYDVSLKSAELVWRLPFHDDFLIPLKSNVADIKNSAPDPKAGSSRAACFLKTFTQDKSYIHLDVAMTADVNNIGNPVMINTLYNFAKEIK